MPSNICNYSPLSTISRKEIDRRFEIIHRNLCYLNSIPAVSNTFTDLFINPTGTESFRVPFILYTQTATKTVANTTVETSLISSGIGSTTIPSGLILLLILKLMELLY